MQFDKRIQDELIYLYGDKAGKDIWPQLNDLLLQFRENSNNFHAREIDAKSLLSQDDVMLITYADQIRKPGDSPLSTLGRFLDKYLNELFSGVHILPFYPYSSDDGFSVINYFHVDPEFGNWVDVTNIGRKFQLMFDGVINHISRESDWFKAFLSGEEPYTNYFITVDPAADVSGVVRPRDLPLLTAYETAKGEFSVWTTFSEDQIDLNYSSPDVLIEIIIVILFYVQKGADFIRLDAIAYLWKDMGTTSIHLPQTHSVIRLFRAVLDKVAPNVLLITETNVPHEENISYFGKYLEETGRTDEAQLVYQFPLAPLILHTFHTGNADSLKNWIENLEDDAMFFNFIASHDGIGLRPAEGLLSSDEIQVLVNLTQVHNGRVSYKTNADGSKSVYELNITLYDALNNPNKPNDELDVKRFLASQAILLSLAGIPGIYFHSLFGLRNCITCVEESKRFRSINREKFLLEDLEQMLKDPNSIPKKVFDGYRNLIHQRRTNKSFHPKGGQYILSSPSSIFGLLRRSLDGREAVLSIINVTDQNVMHSLDVAEFQINPQNGLRDIITNTNLDQIDDLYSISLSPYQVMWISIS